MIDRTSIHVIGGKGGDGAISGRREKYVPRGGPDGGNGGTGGSVYLRAEPDVTTLINLRNGARFAAGDGGNGAGSLKHGKNGSDVMLAVPVGTQVSVVEGEAGREADLADAGQVVCVAEGGRGGRGNASFASSVNRFPVLAEEGEQGSGATLRLELKLLADVGIVGMPNAGKSSLLAAVSGARPRIAGYPFTTLEPVLGVVEWKNREFVAVDIPGLIEGAHRGVGLGHDFLQHVERTRVLVHVVDGASDDPVGDYRQVREELRLFDRSLEDKRWLVALNKTDIPEARSRAEEVVGVLGMEGVEGHPVSASSRDGLDLLLDGVLRLLAEAGSVGSTPPQGNGDEEPAPVLRPRPVHQVPRVIKDGACLVVESAPAARVAAMVDRRNWNAMIQLRRYLKRVGVVKALEDAGVGPGDPVRIGKLEWEWE